MGKNSWVLHGSTYVCFLRCTPPSTPGCTKMLLTNQLDFCCLSIESIQKAFVFRRGKAGFSVVARLTCETLKVELDGLVPSPAARAVKLQWYRGERGLCEHDTNVQKVLHIFNKHLILKAKFLNKRKEGAYFASAWEDCLVLFLGTKVNFINELSRDPGPSIPYPDLGRGSKRIWSSRSSSAT